MQKGKQLLRDLKFYEAYSKYRDDLGRKESWEEAVDDVMRMHYDKFEHIPELREHLDFATNAYRNRLVLASQRNLQYRKEQIVRSNARLYNCCSTYIDRPEVFKQLMFVLLNGCGAGYSVERCNVDKLPSINLRQSHTITHVIADSMEGWSDAIDALLNSFFNGSAQIRFDGSLIRPEGAFISGGFKAPGYEPLRKALALIEDLLNRKINKGDYRLTPLDCHEIICMIADAVISAGVRRSALICLFDKDDMEMMTCKTGNWREIKPWLERANNSVKLLKGSFTFDEFNAFQDYIKQFGEPGVVLVNDMRFCTNPCCEIGFIPINPRNGKSCISFCNLTEINGGQCDTLEKFFEACIAASIIGTLQASYTDFSYLGQDTIDLVEWEALIGVSITGLMENPSILFDAETLRAGAELVKEANAKIAGIIGINPAARCTTIKPSGNASVLLETCSGIHPAHSKRYFRVMRAMRTSELVRIIEELNPAMVENLAGSDNPNACVIYIPVTEDNKTIIKEELSSIEFMQKVRTVYENWVMVGTNPTLGWSRYVTHNVSNTVTVDDWDETFKFIWDNQNSFCGLSFAPKFIDKVYKQVPFTKVMSFFDLITTYGDASLFASGLIVDALHAFNGDLWDACEATRNNNLSTSADRYVTLLRRDIIRRIRQFSKNYFNGDMDLTITCLKDVHLYHKWSKINRTYKEVDFGNLNLKPTYTEVASMGATACNGNQCEVTSI
jgi:ribonucleoside-triphosphate reductase (thioredoxin)